MALVDVEVYSPTGQKVFQKVYDQQAFGAGQTKQYRATWRVPVAAVPGPYVVKVGVFSPGWGTLYHWNNQAAQFTVTNP
jgi:hypothetical protein